MTKTEQFCNSLKTGDTIYIIEHEYKVPTEKLGTGLSYCSFAPALLEAKFVKCEYVYGNSSAFIIKTKRRKQYYFIRCVLSNVTTDKNKALKKIRTRLKRYRQHLEKKLSAVRLKEEEYSRVK